MRIVAVCLPTRGRPRQMETNVLALLHQQYPDDVRLVVMLAACHGDYETVAACVRLVQQWKGQHTLAMTFRPKDSTAIDGWNKALRMVSDADWIVLGADDVNWQPGWLEEALIVADETGAQVIGLNDGGHTDLNQYGPHFMAHRDFINKHLGGMFPPIYRSWWMEREVCEKAQAHSLYAPAWKAFAEHWHPDWKTAVMDETYRRGQVWHDADLKTYKQRKAAGFPLDYLEAK